MHCIKGHAINQIFENSPNANENSPNAENFDFLNVFNAASKNKN